MLLLSASFSGLGSVFGVTFRLPHGPKVTFLACPSSLYSEYISGIIL